MPDRLLRRVRLWLPTLFVFVTTSCFDSRGCDDAFFECDTDEDCGVDAACEEDLLGTSCIPVIECETDLECPDGARCIDLALQTANNPFESTKPGKRVCDCLSECAGLGGGAP